MTLQLFNTKITKLFNFAHFYFIRAPDVVSQRKLCRRGPQRQMPIRMGVLKRLLGLGQSCAFAAEIKSVEADLIKFYLRRC